MKNGSPRTLLIGASGQLGRALKSRFADWPLITASHRHTGPGDLRIDLGDVVSTRNLIEHTSADVILIAGAMCNVDGCEQDMEACNRINTRGPVLIAELARDRGARVVLFGTDHVFDGSRESYVEEDDVNPLNAYARSKANAERLVRELLPDRHLIVRTGWVYGPDPERRNFLLRLIDRVSNGETVAVPADQFGSPTYTDDLAAAVRHLLERDASGTFHATGPEFLDRATLALRICEYFGLDAGRIVPTPTAELRQPARRSLRVLLNCGKLHATGSPRFRTVREGFESIAAWSGGKRPQHA